MASDFGKRLKRLRKRAGLTLEGLAERIGSTKSHVWELENKPNIRPSVETAYKLARALDTTVGVLMGEQEDSELSAEDQVFFRNYQELGEPTKRRLRKILDALKDEEA